MPTDPESSGICVVDAIEQFFDTDRESAMHLMLRVHDEGIAECGTCSYEWLRQRRRSRELDIRFNALSRASGKYSPSEGCFCALLRSGVTTALVVGLSSRPRGTLPRIPRTPRNRRNPRNSRSRRNHGSRRTRGNLGSQQTRHRRNLGSRRTRRNLGSQQTRHRRNHGSLRTLGTRRNLGSRRNHRLAARRCQRFPYQRDGTWRD
jgi:hypothetical protein